MTSIASGSLDFRAILRKYGIVVIFLGLCLVLALVSLATGFRIAFLPFRLCPFIFTLSAVLIALGAWL